MSESTSVNVSPDGAYARTLANVEREQVSWLWAGRVPFGMLTLLVGDPGLGKSLLGLYLAGQVSRGGGDVLLLSAEDHAGVTIRPRAEAAEANLDRIHIVKVRRDGLEDDMTLPNGAAELCRLAESYKARLVIVDPLMAHLPESVNSWRDQSIRRALAPLHRLAETQGCAVLVIGHLNKGKGADPLYRTGGSIGLPAAARSALLLARDPQDPEGERGCQRVLAHHKSNISPLADSLLCRVEGLGDGDSETARLHVLGTSEVEARELLDIPADSGLTERDEAQEFLNAELANGPKSAKELIHGAPCGERTLRKAKADLGIKARKGGFEGGWIWELPQASNGDMSGDAAFAESASLSQDIEAQSVEGGKVTDSVALADKQGAL